MLRMILVMAVILVACNQERSVDGPSRFFKKGRIGSSKDYGVVKIMDAEPVISVYGFVDDYSVCRTVATALNEDACRETGGENCLNPFSCTPLN